MSFRSFLQELRETGQLHTISREVDPHLELAAVIHQLGEGPMLFAQVKGSDHAVSGQTGF